jgi:hypothetical protein
MLVMKIVGISSTAFTLSQMVRSYEDVFPTRVRLMLTLLCISNITLACGQLGQSYQDYKCSAEEAHMECPVKTEMEIKATTNAKWYGAPAPLYCAPKSKHPFTGYWSHSAECNKPWDSPPSYCEEYEGQKAGAFVNTSPSPNSNGRIDVEGCCFWGRGVIQTTGVCNFGKLNYYLGARAAEEGRSSRYPEINFCEQPDAICASEDHKELKWIGTFPVAILCF